MIRIAALLILAAALIAPAYSQLTFTGIGSFSGGGGGGSAVKGDCVIMLPIRQACSDTQRASPIPNLF
jgi:hypothetical protein